MTAATVDTLRAALYARISQDDTGEQRGVDRQLADARAVAEAKGWTVVAEYADNDVSAYKGLRRAGYDDLMRGAQVGAFDRIVVYQTSRLTRNRRERAAMIDTLGARGISVAAVSGPELDLTSASGRLIGEVLGAFDTAESAIKGERVARAARQRAEEGRANGVCPYGWRRVYDYDAQGKPSSFHDVEDHEAAEVVREIVRRIADGDSIRAIARDLTERGVPSPTGLPRWGHTSVRRTALRPANIGKRTIDTQRPEGYGEGNVKWEGAPTPDKPYRGVIIGDAEWPAIVDEVVWQRAVDRLGDSRGNPFTSPGNQPEHLLTGKAGAGQCGVCGAELNVKRRRSKRKRGPDKVYVLYCCAAPSGCVGRSRDDVDALVGAVVVERLARPDAADAFVAPTDDATDAQARIAEVQARLDAAAESYAEGRITVEQMERITAKLGPQLESARTDLRRAAARPTEPPAALDELRQAEHAADVWDDLDTEDRRAVLHALGLTVRIMPTRQGPGFEPRDVQVEWKAGA